MRTRVNCVRQRRTETHLVLCAPLLTLAQNAALLLGTAKQVFTCFTSACPLCQAPTFTGTDNVIPGVTRSRIPLSLSPDLQIFPLGHPTFTCLHTYRLRRTGKINPCNYSTRRGIMFGCVSVRRRASLTRSLPPHSAGEWWWKRLGAALSAELPTGVKGGLTNVVGGGGGMSCCLHVLLVFSKITVDRNKGTVSNLNTETVKS